MKLKSNKGASKRFKITGKGKIARRKSSKSHLLTGKSSKRKRRLKKMALVHKSKVETIRKLLPYH